MVDGYKERRQLYQYRQEEGGRGAASCRMQVADVHPASGDGGAEHGCRDPVQDLGS